IRPSCPDGFGRVRTSRGDEKRSPLLASRPSGGSSVTASPACTGAGLAQRRRHANTKQSPAERLMAALDGATRGHIAPVNDRAAVRRSLGAGRGVRVDVVLLHVVGQVLHVANEAILV